MALKYRAEVDGLRTIAVCSVLIYHAKFAVGQGSFLPGGFLGVDVFFVISGFLISSLIVQEWDRTGRFSILKFYERRARRLLPALFIVIFAALPAAWFILLPTQMEEFVTSLLASLFFVSNMFWHAISLEYGAESGLIKPFLHTWSLAVEEQFYIFFPLIYLFLLRWTPRFFLLFAGIGIVGALLIAEYTTRKDGDLSFYWVISRLWELMAGGFLAHLLARHPEAGHKIAAWRIMPGVGFALLVVPLFIPGLIQSHPGFVTVPTVLGTCLVIWFAHPREPITRLLSSRAMVTVGLISYSLYLWHYPIFAFGRLLDPVPGISDKVIWLILSFGLASLSYRFVERPFRTPNIVSLRKLIGIGLTSTAVVGAFAATMLVQEGYPARLANLYAIYGTAEPDKERIARVNGSTWDALNAMATERGLQKPHVRKPLPIESETLWFDMDRPSEKILILGNSLSADLFSAFIQNQDLFPNRQFARFAMRADFTNRQTDTLLQAPNFKAADTIMISHAYTDQSVERLDPLLDRLIPTGKKIIVLTDSPIFAQVEGRWPFDWYVRINQGIPSHDELNALGYASLDLAQTGPLDTGMADIATRRGVQVLRRRDFICDDDTQRCDMITEDGRKTFSDQHHYTRAGAARFGRKIKDIGWLDQP